MYIFFPSLRINFSILDINNLKFSIRKLILNIWKRKLGFEIVLGPVEHKIEFRLFGYKNIYINSNDEKIYVYDEEKNY